MAKRVHNSIMASNENRATEFEDVPFDADTAPSAEMNPETDAAKAETAELYPWAYAPIADILGMPITVVSDKDGSGFAGLSARNVVFDGLHFSLPITIASSFIDPMNGDAGLLVSVRLDLGLFIWYSPASGVALAGVVNLQVYPQYGKLLFEAAGVKDLADAWPLVKPGVVRQFANLKENEGWHETAHHKKEQADEDASA